MSSSVNKVILIGNLGKDPKVSTMNSGDRVVSFTLATAESWKDKNTGEKREKTEWHNIVIYNDGIGKVAEQYCKKGSKIYIEGQLQTRKYNDQSGTEKYITEIVLQRFRGELTLLGDNKNGGGERGSDDRGSRDDRGTRGGSDRGSDKGGVSSRGSTSDNRRPAIDDQFDDDIPF